MDCLQGYWQCPLAEEARKYFTFVTGDGVFTPTRVLQGVMNATSYFHGIMMEVLENLVGRACLIYVYGVKVIGRSVEELIVNLRAALLRFMERGLFLAAHKLVLFVKEVKWCGKLYSRTSVRYDPGRVRGLVEMRRPETVGELMKFRQIRPRARAWTGGDAPTRDSGRADEVSAGDEWYAFVTASHGGNCGTAVSVDGTSTKGNEPNEKRGVAVDSNGC